MFNGFNFNGDDNLGWHFGDPPENGGGGSTGSGGGTTSPTYNTGGGNAPWWASFINQGFGLTSQIIGAYGHNPTQQIGYGLQSYGHGGYAPQPQALPSGGPQTGGPPNGGLAEDAFGNLTDFIGKHPLPIAAGVVGLYLLMREPPRSRR